MSSRTAIALHLLALLAAKLGAQADTAAAAIAARDRADSIAIAAVLPALVADSVAAERAKHAAARATLEEPIGFAPATDNLSPAAQEILKAKAWLLYRNPGLRLTIRATVNPDAQGGRDLARRRVDNVRKFLNSRAIELTRIGVDELDAQRPSSASADTLSFSSTLDESSIVDVPPTSAEPPPVNPPWLGLQDRNRRYKWGTVRVFYATDRARTGSADPNDFYSGNRATSGNLEFGAVDVIVPRIHHGGNIERPQWYTVERIAGDSLRYMYIKNVVPSTQAKFMDSVRSVVASSGRKEALVFIHGFNVSFRDAALRTAQLTYDLDFDGAPILYSWPSRASIFRYSADREASEFTAAHLAAFLDSVVSVTGVKRVHVIAHSMGNRALTYALERMALAGRRDTLLSTVVMAAADVDALRFQQQTAATIRPLMKRMTIYMSGKDIALWSSRVLSTNKRLGESTDPMLVIPDAETIDATDVRVDMLGHGYIGEAVALLDDLKDIIVSGLSPPRPRLIAAHAADGAPYWRIR